MAWRAVLGASLLLAGCGELPGGAPLGVRFAIQGTYLAAAAAGGEGATWDLARIGAPAALEQERGAAEVAVAVVDTGVDARQPELAGRIYPLVDLVGGDRYRARDGREYSYQGKDGNGHGTHVTGIVRAVTGTTPVMVLPIKAINHTGVGDDGTIAAGVRYAVDWRDGARRVRVINLSIGGKTSSRVLEEALGYAAAHDVLVVVAAGNRARDVDYPAALPTAFAIGATTLSDGLASYSNRGRAVALSAPGGDGAMAISSTWPSYLTATDRAQAEPRVHLRADMAGTSMAAPHVSGAAALLFAQDPGLQASQVRVRLEAWSEDLGPVGPDGYFGVGRLAVRSSLDKGAHDAR